MSTTPVTQSSAEPDPQADQTTSGSNTWAERFLLSVLWTWAGTAALFFTGFFLSPYIIRKLGDSRYGIWALAFAFIDYFSLFDFGFKSAAVNFLSRARAAGDPERINEILNTSLFYFLGIATVLLSVTYGIAGRLHLWFKISPEYQEDFVILIRIIAIGWAVAIGLSVFNAALEGFQQFKIQNSISIASLIL